MAASINLTALHDKMMHKLMPNDIVEGLRNARRGRIQQIHVTGQVITAVVGGAQKFRVSLDTERFPENCSCSCLSTEPCSHMATVLYTVDESLNPSPAVLKALKPSAAAVSPQPQGHFFQAEPPDIISPKPDQPQGWSRYFADAAQRVGGIQQLMADRNEFTRFQSQVMGISDAWRGSSRTAYAVMAEFFFLQALMNRTPQKRVNPRWTEAYGISATDGLMDIGLRRIDRALMSVLPSERDTLRTTYGLILAEGARVMVGLPPQMAHLGAATYRKLWTEILIPTDLLQREVRWLKGRLQQLPAQPRSPVADVLAFLYMLAGEDHQAWALLAEVHASQRFMVAEPILSRLEGDSPQRMYIWMKHLSASSTLYDPDMVLACKHWASLVEKYPEAAADYENYLASHLPYSENAYHHYLLQAGRFRDWAERYLLEGRLPPDIPRDEMRVVEDGSRHTLLPLYHQAVVRHILQKNRTAYKVAVKLLAKLRAHYRRLKREGEWHRFIAEFLQEHARQHALIEELKAGRLID